MPTEKIDLSLRLRHEHADMASLIKQIGMQPRVHWNKADPRQTPTGTPLEGHRDFSYCSFPLIKKATTELDEMIVECFELLAPIEHLLQGFVKSGGSATLAVGWFCDGDSGADISERTISELARMSLKMDFYLYFTATAPTTQV